MAIYIDEKVVQDVENISSQVFRYLIDKHKKELGRLQKNKDYYLGKHNILFSDSDDTEKVRVFSNYAKYVVDVTQGYYLGEPIKYNGTEIKKPQKSIFNNGIEAVLRNGTVTQFEPKNANRVDISDCVEAYDNQTISEVDATIGKHLGIYGESYELLYANDKAEPRSVVISPLNCIMVRDTSVEHRKLFAIVYEQREDLGNVKYYHVTVYTDKTVKEYRSSNLETFEFNMIEGSEQEHYFGEVPLVEYRNNDERQGDFEQVIPLIDGLNELLSDRVTDKKKFVNSLLAMFGITLNDDDIKILAKERFLDGVPTDARIEYIQKVFDEGSMNILCNDIIREIHKMTLTVDMTDNNFAGNSSGQALMLKLMTMNMLVKNKMRNLEKGLKKRFEMYNRWLNLKNGTPIVDKKDVDIIFTISMPIDKQEIINTVVSLQGIVDDKTLLSQLWFVKDVEETLALVKEQKLEAQKQYLDSFAMQRGLEQSFDNVNGYSRGLNEEDEESTEEVVKKA